MICAIRDAPVPCAPATAVSIVGSVSRQMTSPNSRSRLPTQRNNVARLTPAAAAKPPISIFCPDTNVRRAIRCTDSTRLSATSVAGST